MAGRADLLPEPGPLRASRLHRQRRAHAASRRGGAAAPRPQPDPDRGRPRPGPGGHPVLASHRAVREAGGFRLPRRHDAGRDAARHLRPLHRALRPRQAGCSRWAPLPRRRPAPTILPASGSASTSASWWTGTPASTRPGPRQARGELQLTGTLASIGMTGTMAFLPGARGFYRGNEFVLSRAVADFTDRNRLRMVLDVTARRPSRTTGSSLHVTATWTT